MNLQELEKVTEIINNLGDKTLEGLTIFIGANFIIDLISYGVGVLFLVLSFKLINPVLSTIFINQKAILALRALRDMLKVGCPGALVDSEIDEIVKAVKKLIQ
jgi:hypothetical protein